MQINKNSNGDFLVKMDKYDNENLVDRQGIELIWDLVNSAELDFDIAGDQACAGNFEMYYPLFNAYTRLMYLVLDRDLEAYRQGKRVKLSGYVPSDEELDAYYERNSV